MGYIYCITNLINSKKYVGKTINSLDERWREHQNDYQRSRCEKRPLYDAMNKYGIENFKIEEIEYIEDDSKLSEREVYWINELQTYGRNGYNATKGGDGKILYDHNEIIELARLGYTREQISKKLGCIKETISKVLKAHGIKLRNAHSKLIAQYDLAGNFIQVFYGSREAQKWLQENNITQNSGAHVGITRCCNEVQQEAFGYIWKYMPEPI